MVTDSHVAELHLPRLLDSLRKAGIDARPIVMPPGRSQQKLRGAGKTFRRAAGHGNRPRGLDRRAGRRGDRRSHRLRRRRAQARRRFRADSDHSAGPGGFLGRRQDRDQRAPRQEPDRPVPSAAHRDRRHRAALHAAPARIAGRLCRSRQIWRAGRRGLLRMARSEWRAGACRRQTVRSSMPSRIPAA